MTGAAGGGDGRVGEREGGKVIRGGWGGGWSGLLLLLLFFRLLPEAVDRVLGWCGIKPRVTNTGRCCCCCE